MMNSSTKRTCVSWHWVSSPLSKTSSNNSDSRSTVVKTSPPTKDNTRLLTPVGTSGSLETLIVGNPSSFGLWRRGKLVRGRWIWRCLGILGWLCLVELIRGDGFRRLLMWLAAAAEEVRVRVGIRLRWRMRWRMGFWLRRFRGYDYRFNDQLLYSITIFVFMSGRDVIIPRNDHQARKLQERQGDHTLVDCLKDVTWMGRQPMLWQRLRRDGPSLHCGCQKYWVSQEFFNRLSLVCMRIDLIVYHSSSIHQDHQFLITPFRSKRTSRNQFPG